MRTWSDQDAKAKFSEFLDACLIEDAQKAAEIEAWLNLLAQSDQILPTLIPQIMT